MPFNQINHNFNVELTIVRKDGTERKLTNAVKSIHIKKDFMTHIFPLYVLKLSLMLDDLKELMMNDVDILLNIYRYNKADVSTDTAEGDSANVTYDKNVLSVRLHPYDKQKFEIDTYSQEVDNESTETVKVQTHDYQITCLQQQLISSNNTILNDIYNNTNLTTVMVNMLSSVYNGSAYVQQADNINRYSKIVLPPCNFVNGLRFLHNNYTIYNSPLNVFFDDSIVYIYGIGSKLLDQHNVLTINVINSDQNNDASIYKTYYADEFDNVNITLKSTPSVISNNEVTYDELGNTAIYHSYDENFELTTREYTVGNSDEMNKIRYYWNSKNLNSELESRKRLNQISNIALVNVDPSIFTPITEIKINGSTIDENNGNYRLLGIACSFQTSGYVSYTSSVNLTFGK